MFQRGATPGARRDNQPSQARLPCGRGGWYDKCRFGGLPETPRILVDPDPMPKTPRDRQPEPLAREVDRLLAQLANVGSQPARDQAPRGEARAPHSITQPKSPGVAPSIAAPRRGVMVALWARLLLGLALGGSMTQWPYPHGCGLPLLGYLGAVMMVLLTGAWIGFASWKLRSGVTHILSLILFFWGIVLAAEQLLPRIGYAADRASWRCPLELSLHGHGRLGQAAGSTTTRSRAAKRSPIWQQKAPSAQPTYTAVRGMRSRTPGSGGVNAFAAASSASAVA